MDKFTNPGSDLFYLSFFVVLFGDVKITNRRGVVV